MTQTGTTVLNHTDDSAFAVTAEYDAVRVNRNDYITVGHFSPAEARALAAALLLAADAVECLLPY